MLLRPCIDCHCSDDTQRRRGAGVTGRTEGVFQKLSLAWERARRPAAPERVHMSDPDAAQVLCRAVVAQLAARLPERDQLSVVCIGTDRSTGDSLGPLVGSQLSRHPLPGVRVWGTLDDPVHAANLRDVLARMQPELAQARTAVIAVDACLGRSESVGWISVKPGALRPGTGVNKDLPAVGDLHIMGVVNVGGFMEYFVLQNTRLSLVMRMADVIAEGLRLALQEWCSGREAAASGVNARRTGRL